MLAPQGSNWKSILMHSSPAPRGPCTPFGPAEQRGSAACLSPPALFKGWAPRSPSHAFLGRKRNFSVRCPSAKECVYAAPSARRRFGAAHQTALIPIRQGSKLLRLPVPGSWSYPWFVQHAQFSWSCSWQTSDFTRGSHSSTLNHPVHVTQLFSSDQAAPAFSRL